MKNQLKAPGDRYEIHNEIPKVQEWKIHWKRQRIDMKFIMKSTEVWNEFFIEKAGEWIWNWQWNSRDTRMKSPLKAPGHKYEIHNEIPEVQEWKIHWKC